MTQLVRFDTTALNRALIGFDQIFNDFDTRFANQLNSSYPPYNIIQLEADSYEIQVAVAGFSKDEITVEVDQNQLMIKGSSEKDQTAVQYLHRGLAARNFHRSFTLAEYMEVGEAEIVNGVLSVKIKRIIPEALKPRMIEVKAI